MQNCLKTVLCRSVLRSRGRGLLLGPVRHVSRDMGQPTHFTHPELLADGELLPGMHKSEFASRRSRLMAEIAKSHTGMTNPSHLVIVPGAPIKYMSHDVPYRFHQNPDLLYLTGYQEPDAVLILESNSLPDHKSILYVRPRDPRRELWDGPRPGPDGAVDLTGVDEAYSIEVLENHLEHRYSTQGHSVWYYTEETIHPEHDKTIISGLTNSPKSKISSVHSPTHVLQSLRLVKSPSEIALMRRAGEITAKAFRNVMEATRAGMVEQQLESIFEHSVKMKGAQWMSFPPVVAGGARANCLHYIANNKRIKAGELLLMDAGCEYYGYASDVTRTWPVSGQFTAAQRDLYEAVLRVKQESIKSCRPGVTLNYLHSNAVDMLTSELQKLGIVSDRLSGTELYETMNLLYPHHLGHYLGLDTHDTMHVDRNSLLSPGMVVTIEPGIYVPSGYSPPDPKARELNGTGIRLEDDVLVMEEGPGLVLNSGCPESVQELTAIVGKN